MNDNNSWQFHTVRGYQMLNQRDGQLTPAMEDYLEMIYRICLKDSYARVGKLSELLHVKPSSASKMIFKLSELGYIKYDRYEIIFLTDKGNEAGEFLLHRHNAVESFLKLIGIADTLEETELLEHSVNPETVARLNRLIHFFREDGDAYARYLNFVGKGDGTAAAKEPP